MDTEVIGSNEFVNFVERLKEISVNQSYGRKKRGHMC
jgi:hypothetical protein